MSEEHQTWGGGTGGSGSLSEDSSTSSGSRLLIKVPKYDGTRSSYVRLGAVPNNEVEPGMDLARKAVASTPAVLTAGADPFAGDTPADRGGLTLFFKIDDGAPQTVTLPSPCTDVNAAIAAFNPILGMVATKTDDGLLVLTSETLGGGSKVEVTGGTAADYFLWIGAAPAVGESDGVFIDDDRDRGVPFAHDRSNAPTDPVQSGGDPNNPSTNPFLSQDQRRAESARLFTKGGWQEHTDGTRVSTTRGDKVEVIGGNYKLVVLGRQDDPGGAASWEASGGLIVDGDAAPGSISEIKWVKDQYDGTWRVTEETEKGDVNTTFRGDLVESFFGKNVTSTVGSATPAATIKGLFSDPTTTELQLNPMVVESTWAQSISSYQGSSKTPIPSIDELIQADVSNSTTQANSITEVTLVHASGAATAGTTGGLLDTHGAPVTFADAGQIRSNVEAGSTSDTLAVSGSITETITATGTLSSTLKAGTIDETNGEASKSNEFHASHDGDAREIWMGNFAEIFLGAHESMRICPASVECSIGLSVEAFLCLRAVQLFIGTAFELHLGSNFSAVLGNNFEYALVDEEDGIEGGRIALAIFLG